MGKTSKPFASQESPCKGSKLRVNLEPFVFSMPGTRVYTAVIFRFFSAFAIFRLLAARNAYTSTALIFRVFRIFLLLGYLPAATHTCISPPATARLVSHIVNQLLLAIITAAKLILVLWLRRYSESCRVPLKPNLCTASLGIS